MPLLPACQKLKLSKYTHALIRGKRDEKCVDDLCTRLDRAKAELTARIVTAHVGLSGTLRNSFTATSANLRRVDSNVQMVLEERLSLAAPIAAPVAAQFHERSLDEDGTV
jgi:hypothetical protein